MKISIITPTYNSDKTLERTIESVLNQTLLPMEHIFIDGASKDETLQILGRYKQEYERKGVNTTLISEPDNGAYDAMNKGIGCAKGNVIGILNSDDFYTDEALETVKNGFEALNADVVYGLMRIIDNGKVQGIVCHNYDVYLLDIKKGWGGGQHPTVFVKKTLYEKIGKFNLSYPVGADYDFLIRAKKSNAKFLLLEKVITNYCMGGISSNAPIKQIKSEVRAIQLAQGLLSSKQAKKDKLYDATESICHIVAKKVAKYGYWIATNRMDK